MKGLVCRVLSLVSYRKLERSFCNNVSSSSNPLVSRLLQTPNSQVKTTLDSVDVFSLNNSQFFWDALITSLRCSSPDKARLVFFNFLSFVFFFGSFSYQFAGIDLLLNLLIEFSLALALLS